MSLASSRRSQKFNLDDPQLLLIQNAIQENRVLHLRYRGYQKEDVTERDVEPHQLFYTDGLVIYRSLLPYAKGHKGFSFLTHGKEVTPLNETFRKMRTGRAQAQPIIVIKIRFRAKRRALGARAAALRISTR